MIASPQSTSFSDRTFSYPDNDGINLYYEVIVESISGTLSQDNEEELARVGYIVEISALSDLDMKVKEAQNYGGFIDFLSDENVGSGPPRYFAEKTTIASHSFRESIKDHEIDCNDLTEETDTSTYRGKWGLQDCG